MTGYRSPAHVCRALGHAFSPDTGKCNRCAARNTLPGWTRMAPGLWAGIGGRYTVRKGPAGHWLALCGNAVIGGPVTVITDAMVSAHDHWRDVVARHADGVAGMCSVLGVHDFDPPYNGVLGTHHRKHHRAPYTGTCTRCGIIMDADKHGNVSFRLPGSAQS
jgi:hypothetical protein